MSIFPPFKVKTHSDWINLDRYKNVASGPQRPCWGDIIQKRKSRTKNFLGNLRFLRCSSLTTGIWLSPTMAQIQILPAPPHQHTYSGIWQRKAAFTWCRTPSTGFHRVEGCGRATLSSIPLKESCILLEGDELGPTWPPFHSAHRNTAQDCPARKFLDSVGFSHFPFSELSFEQKLNKSPKLRGETQKTARFF